MVAYRFLGDVATGRDNNFNLIRMLAACGVLVSHAFPLARGAGTAQPLQETLGIELGSLCVFVFFGLSGFLIAQSYDRTESVIAWGTARVLRIMPALVVVVALSTFVLGPLFTTLPLAEYFSARETWTFLAKEISLIERQWGLPGVFDDNPYAMTVNGSIWTLGYEVACYALILGIGLLGAFGNRRIFLQALGVFLLLYGGRDVLDEFVEVPKRINSFFRLGLPFMIGATFFFFRRSIPLSWPLAAAGFALVFVAMGAGGPTPVSKLILTLALVYAVFVAAYLPAGAIRRYNMLGDYSYGVYLYAWPTQQMAASITGPTSPFVNILLATPVVLALAFLSWRIVEKPALDARPVVAAFLGRLANRLGLRVLTT